MSSTPPLSPQVVGQAENAHRAILERALAGTGITYHQWVALTITAASGDVVDRDTLVGRMAGALKMDDATASATIAALVASGLLETPAGGESRVGLTSTGRTKYGERRAAVDEVVAAAYAEIAPDELATAGRVLSTITARLNEELADG